MELHGLIQALLDVPRESLEGKTALMRSLGIVPRLRL